MSIATTQHRRIWLLLVIVLLGARSWMEWRVSRSSVEGRERVRQPGGERARRAMERASQLGLAGGLAVLVPVVGRESAEAALASRKLGLAGGRSPNSWAATLRQAPVAALGTSLFLMEETSTEASTVGASAVEAGSALGGGPTLKGGRVTGLTKCLM